MRRTCFTSLLGVLVATQPLVAASLITDLVEADGTWTIGQAELAYLPADSGLTPTAGQVMMHFNAGGDAASYGTSFVNYTNTFAQGTYIAQIDVGSFTNRPLATIGSLGLTVDGQLLTPGSSSTPTPAQGEFKTWTLTYTNKLSSSDKKLGFRLSVPYTGEFRNIAFDNLRVQFFPNTNTVPAGIYHAVEICWESEANKTYQVQWSPSVGPPSWQNLGPLQIGTGTTMCYLDSTRSHALKIYRILLWP